MTASRVDLPPRTVSAPGIPAQNNKCRIPNPPMSTTLGKSISAIWTEHTAGHPPDFPSVRLTALLHSDLRVNCICS